MYAAEAVVPAAGVGRDGGEYAPHVRVQAMPGGELGGVLALEGIRQVQPLALLLGVEQHQADVGAAFEIGQTQQLAPLEDEGGVAAARNGFLVQRGADRE